MNAILSLIVFGLIALLCRDLIALSLRELPKKDSTPFGLPHGAVFLLFMAFLMGPLLWLEGTRAEPFVLPLLVLALLAMLRWEDKWRVAVQRNWEKVLRREPCWLMFLLAGSAVVIIYQLGITIVDVYSNNSNSYIQTESKPWYLNANIWFYLGLLCAGIAAAVIYFLSENGYKEVHGWIVVQLFGFALALCWGTAIVVSFLGKIGLTNGSNSAASIFFPF